MFMGGIGFEEGNSFKMRLNSLGSSSGLDKGGTGGKKVARGEVKLGDVGRIQEGVLYGPLS
jgi:hypothetical protein